MKERRDRSHLARIVVGYIALLVGVMAVVAITAGPGSFPVANSDPATAGASGLARPHEPLDRVPGEPLEAPFAGEKTARRGGSFVGPP